MAKPAVSTPRTPGAILSTATAAGLSAFWRLAVTYLTHMVLRTTIAPAEWAVWTWAEPVFILLAQVRDLGVSGHVVRHHDRPYGNYLRLQLGWGGVFAAALAVLAPVLALGFAGRNQDTVPILRALAVFLFVQGLGSVPLTYFEAENRIARTVPAELLRNASFAVIAIALAAAGHGVWSIVIAHLAAATLYAATLWWSARGAPLRVSLAGATWPLVLGSLPLMVMSMLEMAVLYLEPILLGARLPAEAVGLAGLAILLLFLVSRQLADAAGRAVYPALVRYREDLPRAFEIFRLATGCLAVLFVPAAFVLALNAEAIVLAMALGERGWLGATDYLRAAAFVPFVRPLTMFGRELLLVVYRDRLLLLYTALNLVALGGLGWWLVNTRLGAIGMAVAAYFPLGMVPLAWGLDRLDRPGFRRLVRDLLELYALGALCFTPAWLVPHHQLGARALGSLFGALVFVLLAWRRHRRAAAAFLEFD